jgi:hypothetical protein
MSQKYKDVPHNSRSSKGKLEYSMDEVTPNHLLTSCTGLGKTF